MKRLMKKTSSTLSILEDMVDRNELPSEDKIKESIMNDSEKTPKILELVNQIYGDISPEIQMVAVQNMPWSVRVIENPTEEVQQYILEYAEKNRRSDLIHMVNNPNKDVMEKKMRPHARHDAHNRDWAWAYIDGEIYRAHNHPECFEKYRRQKENQEFEVGHREQIKEYVEKNETKTPVACGALVYEGVYDYTGEKNSIYIDPVTVFNVTLEEVVQKLKEEFPDYKIYNDDEFEIDVENNKIKYTRLAKLKRKAESKLEYIKRMWDEKEISIDGYGFHFKPEEQIKVRHGDYNREAAIVFIDGKWYEGEDHGEAINQYYEENKKEKENFIQYEAEKFISGHRVLKAYDGTDNDKCIYLLPSTIIGMSLEEAVESCKEQYPDYEIYDDETGQLIDDGNGFRLSYTRLGKMAVNTMRLRKKLASVDYKNAVKVQYVVDGEINWDELIGDLLISSEINGGLVGEAYDDDVEELEDSGIEIENTVMEGVLYARNSLKTVLKNNTINEEEQEFINKLNEVINEEKYQQEFLEFCRDGAYEVAEILKENMKVFIINNVFKVNYEYLGY